MKNLARSKSRSKKVDVPKQVKSIPRKLEAFNTEIHRQSSSMRSPSSAEKTRRKISPEKVVQMPEPTTPKRRKDALAKLNSTLSSKYIGFSTPVSSSESVPFVDSSSETRRSRQRTLKKNVNSSSNENSAEEELFFSMNGIGCIRRTSKSISDMRSPLSSSLSPSPSRISSKFESPIEKLLRKNGSANILSSPPRSTDVFPNVTVALERLPSLKLMQTNSILAPNSSPVDEESSDKYKNNTIDGEISSLPNDIVQEEYVEEVLQTTNNNHIINNTSLITTDDVNSTLSAQTEVIEKRTNNHIRHHFLIHDELHSVKSPSTLSIDSAKGSSIDTEGEITSWVQTGDLFWGQIFQYSYWPCMVCPDPDGKTISFSDVRQQTQHIMIHVRFFADNARRSWVKKENLLPYTGLNNYNKKKEDALARYGKKSSKYKAFVVSKAKMKLWEQGVLEADEIVVTLYEDRLERFFQIYENVREQNNLKRKRRQSMFTNHSKMVAASSDLNETNIMDTNDSSCGTHPTHAKRQRSPTPASPAYSPLKSSGSYKVRKIDELEARRVHDETSLNSTEHDTTNLTITEKHKEHDPKPIASKKVIEEINEDVDIEKFFLAIRAFVMKKNRDAAIEQQVMASVRNLWALKYISQHQSVDNEFDGEESLDEINGRIKRESKRIRKLAIEKKLLPTVMEESPKTLEKIKKPAMLVNRPIQEVVDDIFELDSKYLFRGLAIEPVCKYCQTPDRSLQKCSKLCHSWLHLTCLSSYKPENIESNSIEAVQEVSDLSENISANVVANRSNENVLPDSSTPLPIDKVICDECLLDEAPKCFVCNRNSPDLEQQARCNNTKCGKTFHPKCLRYWPQAKLTMSANKIQSLRCPAHVCHTCVSDNPKGKFLYIARSELTKCIKCPATYHMDSTCIPAGSQILTASCIICPRHNTYKVDPLINVNWCFICVSGGKLICCETCPTAVHPECLNIPIVPEEGYICEECETGRMPLYGEMVWAKFNNFRWWPAIILPPTEIPENLQRKPHNKFEFVVRFFGTNDHGWISRRRVYLYQEGDCLEPPRTNKKGLDHNYLKGVEEAKRIVEIIKEKKLQHRSSAGKKQRISPLPYVKIKVNRAVPPVKLQVNLEKISKCDCSKNSENPCGPDTDCLNRVLFTECNPKICPAGDSCQNQMFESRIYPKLDVIYMNERGFGLVCREPISAGTFVIEYVGEVIDDAEFKRRIAEKELERDENFYFLTLEKDYIIDAGPKGNMARFMNHSCEPNCETQKWSVNGLNRIGLFAIKDIPADTELTFNYYWDELLGNEKKICHCGAPKCAGQIGGKYKEPTKQLEVHGGIQTSSIKRKKSGLPKKKLTATDKPKMLSASSKRLASRSSVKTKSTSITDKKRIGDVERASGNYSRIESMNNEMELHVNLSEAQENQSKQTNNC